MLARSAAAQPRIVCPRNQRSTPAAMSRRSPAGCGTRVRSASIDDNQPRSCPASDRPTPRRRARAGRASRLARLRAVRVAAPAPNVGAARLRATTPDAQPSRRGESTPDVDIRRSCDRVLRAFPPVRTPASQEVTGRHACRRRCRAPILTVAPPSGRRQRLQHGDPQMARNQRAD